MRELTHQHGRMWLSLFEEDFPTVKCEIVTFYYPVTDLLVILERVERKSRTAALWSVLQKGIESL